MGAFSCSLAQSVTWMIVCLSRLNGHLPPLICFYVFTGIGSDSGQFLTQSTDRARERPSTDLSVNTTYLARIVLVFIICYLQVVCESSKRGSLPSPPPSHPVCVIPPSLWSEDSRRRCSPPRIHSPESPFWTGRHCGTSDTTLLSLGWARRNRVIRRQDRLKSWSSHWSVFLRESHMYRDNGSGVLGGWGGAADGSRKMHLPAKEEE